MILDIQRAVLSGLSRVCEDDWSVNGKNEGRWSVLVVINRRNIDWEVE